MYFPSTASLEFCVTDEVLKSGFKIGCMHLMNPKRQNSNEAAKSDNNDAKANKEWQFQHKSNSPRIKKKKKKNPTQRKPIT